MPRTTSAFLVAIFTIMCGASRAGEAGKTEQEKPPSIYTEVSWRQAQAYAAKAEAVLVATVTEAGKPSGKGWSRNTRGIRPGIAGRTDNTLDIGQDLAVEIAEVLRGQVAPGALRVRIGKLACDYAVIQKRAWNPQAKDIRKRQRASIPAKELALEKGRRYIFFLTGPQDEGKKNERKGEKKEGEEEAATEAEPAPATPILQHLDSAAPAEVGDDQIVNSVRAFCGVLADWADPPAPSPEKEALVRRLIKQLSSDDYREREAADEALRRLGAWIRPHIEKAAADPDAERAWRARNILEAIEPAPGAAELPAVMPRKPQDE